MKGIILAGGLGSRLYPVTIGVSKQLLPVYDKPMIYYPLSVLMLADIQDILIITTKQSQPSFEQLLGDGSSFGINLSYKIQEPANGLAEAFIIGEKFIGADKVCLALGDNIFHGSGLSKLLNNAKNNDGGTIFGYKVKDPERFGVLEMNKQNKVLSVEEKPREPKSNYAITGLYFYDNDVIDIAKNVTKSSRGELEITSVNEAYLKKGKLNAILLERGYAWLDTGTPESLLEASQFIEVIERRQGYKIACLEEIGLANGWIDEEQVNSSIEYYNNNEYAQYLRSLIYKKS